MNQHSTTSRSKRRYWILDLMRFGSIFTMAFFHFTYDLRFFFMQKVFLNNEWYWMNFPRMIAASFLFVAGIALHISYEKGHRTILKRFLKIFGLGMIITLVTVVLDLGGRIYFGILHNIATSLVVGYFLCRFRNKYLLGIFGILVVLYSHLVVSKVFGDYPNVMFWAYSSPSCTIGRMIDYYPLFPYVGYLIIGITAGRFMFPKGIPRFDLGPAPSLLKPLIFIGQHSLTFYLLHQPIFIGLLYLYFKLFL